MVIFFYQTMIWFDKSFIKFCNSFINLIKLVSALTCSSTRVRLGWKKEHVEKKCSVLGKREKDYCQ